MKRETKGVEDMINQGRTAFLSAPGLTGMLEGGVPILVSGQCVGAVGVSGVQAAQEYRRSRVMPVEGTGASLVPTATMLMRKSLARYLSKFSDARCSR